MVFFLKLFIKHLRKNCLPNILKIVYQTFEGMLDTVLDPGDKDGFYPLGKHRLVREIQGNRFTHG